MDGESESVTGNLGAGVAVMAAQSRSLVYWLTGFYDRLSLPVMVTDLDARIIYVNASFVKTTGYRADEVLGKNPRMLASGQTKPEVYSQMWRALTAGDDWHGQLSNRRKTGEVYIESMHISPIVDPAAHPTHYVGIWLDVTDDVTEREQLRVKVRTDELTGVLNRRGLVERLDAEVHRARRHRRPLTAMLVDLDDFKAINDRHGHAIGDAVLRETAHAISCSVRHEDCVGRYGGDEFLVLLPDTLPGVARLVANRVVAAVKRVGAVVGAASGGKFVGAPCSVSCSVGVAAVDGLGDLGLDKLVRRVDRLLYAAKSAGKNRVRGAESE